MALRVFCTLDPTPFCAHCEVRCFKAEERTWDRPMMRCAGPRSWASGFARQGARHFVGSVRARIRRLKNRT
ncbi:nitrous oxide-stimulated promoter family protein [Brachybacterium epidermidis]|uniref:nitrous oxide-stimulated promoter family protein n=1 Tax=Brachybacterium epidermidis TaxID=2781983 RepID=UPI00398F4552